jgi:hypothetical protein
MNREMLTMLTEDDDATAQLKRAVTRYLKGEGPSPAELADAPLLENWQAIATAFVPERGPLTLAMVLVGRVTGHPRVGDARSIRTSQLIWLDQHRKWARTWNRVYRLGERASGEPITQGLTGEG